MSNKDRPTVEPAQSARPRATFRNPLMAGQDPSIVQRKGIYHLVQSDGGKVIRLRIANGLTGLPAAQPLTVWTAPATGNLCCNVWAPELVAIGDRWYIYFAADDGNNANHRMYVLESAGQDPRGPYSGPRKVAPATDRWAIDGTVLQLPDGSLYFIWSGWEGSQNIQQNLYIAAMRDPRTIEGDRSLISEPTEPWERIGGPPYINEGPEILQRNNRLYLVYSASGSWTDDYCLGMLVAPAGADIMNRASWTKSSQPVFAKVPTAYGPGHNCFFRSPDDTEDWIAYHANVNAGTGWNGRSLRAQPFTWNRDGTPYFAQPVPTNQDVPVPSGE
jgi:GH43 family beta-xylosidase